ncbi:MAG: uroporphyrinogen decarboxylase family protein [Bdellovibrionota bacterium]
MMNLFQSALAGRNSGPRPPIWFMRQAGRYHNHYQKLKQTHSFIDLCKIPSISCEAALGPVSDFGFDAAILFSDLLFPLEILGQGLTYDEGPTLAWHISHVSDLSRLRHSADPTTEMGYQAHALRLLKSQLPPETGLLGFVGGPLTLYFYAVAGSHQKKDERWALAQAGIRNGLFQAFCEILNPLLARNMTDQAAAGADTIAVLDTCAGEVPLAVYEEIVIPVIKDLLSRSPHPYPVTYYSKGTDPSHWELLRPLAAISAIGVDWRSPLAPVLDRFSDRFAIQGNFDPEKLRSHDLPSLDRELRAYFQPIRALPASKRRGWISGLGHGVLPKTPEENIRHFIKCSREIFDQ